MNNGMGSSPDDSDNDKKKEKERLLPLPQKNGARRLSDSSSENGQEIIDFSQIKSDSEDDDIEQGNGLILPVRTPPKSWKQKCSESLANPVRMGILVCIVGVILLVVTLSVMEGVDIEGISVAALEWLLALGGAVVGAPFVVLFFRALRLHAQKTTQYRELADKATKQLAETTKVLEDAEQALENAVGQGVRNGLHAALPMVIASATRQVDSNLTVGTLPGLIEELTKEYKKCKQDLEEACKRNRELLRQMQDVKPVQPSIATTSSSDSDKKLTDLQARYDAQQKALGALNNQLAQISTRLQQLQDANNKPALMPPSQPQHSVLSVVVPVPFNNTTSHSSTSSSSSRAAALSATENLQKQQKQEIDNILQQIQQIAQQVAQLTQQQGMIEQKANQTDTKATKAEAKASAAVQNAANAKEMAAQADINARDAIQEAKRVDKKIDEVELGVTQNTTNIIQLRGRVDKVEKRQDDLDSQLKLLAELQAQLKLVQQQYGELKDLLQNLLQMKKEKKEVQVADNKRFEEELVKFKQTVADLVSKQGQLESSVKEVKESNKDVDEKINSATIQAKDNYSKQFAELRDEIVAIGHSVEQGALQGYVEAFKVNEHVKELQDQAGKDKQQMDTKLQQMQSNITVVQQGIDDAKIKDLELERKDEELSQKINVANLKAAEMNKQLLAVKQAQEGLSKLFADLKAMLDPLKGDVEGLRKSTDEQLKTLSTALEALLKKCDEAQNKKYNELKGELDKYPSILEKVNGLREKITELEKDLKQVPHLLNDRLAVNAQEVHDAAKQKDDKRDVDVRQLTEKLNDLAQSVGSLSVSSSGHTTPASLSRQNSTVNLFSSNDGTNANSTNSKQEAEALIDCAKSLGAVAISCGGDEQLLESVPMAREFQILARNLIGQPIDDADGHHVKDKLQLIAKGKFCDAATKHVVVSDTYNDDVALSLLRDVCNNKIDDFYGKIKNLKESVLKSEQGTAFLNIFRKAFHSFYNDHGDATRSVQSGVFKDVYDRFQKETPSLLPKFEKLMPQKAVSSTLSSSTGKKEKDAPQKAGEGEQSSGNVAKLSCLYKYSPTLARLVILNTWKFKRGVTAENIKQIFEQAVSENKFKIANNAKGTNLREVLSGIFKSVPKGTSLEDKKKICIEITDRIKTIDPLLQAIAKNRIKSTSSYSSGAITVYIPDEQRSASKGSLCHFVEGNVRTLEDVGGFDRVFSGFFSQVSVGFDRKEEMLVAVLNSAIATVVLEKPSIFVPSASPSSSSNSRVRKHGRSVSGDLSTSTSSVSSPRTPSAKTLQPNKKIPSLPGGNANKHIRASSSSAGARRKLEFADSVNTQPSMIVESMSSSASLSSATTATSDILPSVSVSSMSMFVSSPLQASSNAVRIPYSLTQSMSTALSGSTKSSDSPLSSSCGAHYSSGALTSSGLFAVNDILSNGASIYESKNPMINYETTYLGTVLKEFFTQERLQLCDRRLDYSKQENVRYLLSVLHLLNRNVQMGGGQKINLIRWFEDGICSQVGDKKANELVVTWIKGLIEYQRCNAGNAEEIDKILKVLDPTSMIYSPQISSGSQVFSNASNTPRLTLSSDESDSRQ